MAARSRPGEGGEAAAAARGAAARARPPSPTPTPSLDPRSLFLAKFYREGTAWAHLDIAGPAWDDAAGGATGFGVATLVEWALARARAARE